ncbi:hypothetical protein E2C01_020310 [Portunus trituberculatus]|uniref:Uncharacterized protein n=1 Tax=Portunus trituberculatus TaxID=210409 RepID=A0A5B7E1D5_PORTR|nr:hypothetical protein [Portunus trituberculatus]
MYFTFVISDYNFFCFVSFHTVQVILQKLCLSEILSKEMDRLDEDQLASSRKPSGVHRKKEQSAFTTSTQKPPSTAVLHSRKDFKASVSEEQFGLDIEELQETTEHRKRPRGGAQQTLSKWVEPDTPCQTEASCEPCLEDSSDDDLEIIRPKKQKSRKEEERERNIQTQAKNTKRKKTRKKASKEGSSRDDTRQPDASPPSSFSHMDRAGQDLLKDLDDFAEDTWTPKNIKENFISAIAKFAYKKPGKDTSTKQSVVQELSPNKDNKHNSPGSKIMESAIAKLKCFSYSPQDDETAKTLTLNTNNREAECVNETSVHECPEGKSDINASTTHGLDVSDASHLRVSNINTPPSSSSSSSTSTYFPTKPKTKHKRFCFALSEEEEEDVDLFAGPVTQARVSDSEGERQALAGKNITPQSFLLKKPLLSPSPVVGRMKLPVVSEGVGKYEALASEELDDFDFEL